MFRTKPLVFVMSRQNNVANEGVEARFHLMAVIIKLYTTGTLLMTAAAQQHATLNPGVSPGEWQSHLGRVGSHHTESKIKPRASFLNPGK